MSGERIERNQLVLRDTDGNIFSDYPINFAGAALLMRNDSESDSVVSVDDSADGSTWATVLLSTHSLAGQTSVTVPALSYVVILFTSASAYVRLKLAADNEEGIYASLVQYPPKAREEGSEYA